MKKTCLGCVALVSGTITRCSLGYKNTSQVNRSTGGIFRDFIPLENCPKPTTIKKYISLVNIKKISK